MRVQTATRCTEHINVHMEIKPENFNLIKPLLNEMLCFKSVSLGTDNCVSVCFRCLVNTTRGKNNACMLSLGLEYGSRSHFLSVHVTSMRCS